MHTVLDYIERTQEQIDFAKPNLTDDIARREKLMKAINDANIEGLDEFTTALKEQINNEKAQLARVIRDEQLLKELRLEYDVCDAVTKSHIDAIIAKYFTVLNITLPEDESKPA